MHLAVTKKICETYRCKDPKRLNFGAVLPDYSGDRQRAHMRAIFWGRNKRTYDLNGFRELFGEKMREDDLYLGYYLHLVQDVCYRHFVYDRFHWNPNIPGHVEKLHNDYNILNRYVREKYGLHNDLSIPSGFSEEPLSRLALFYPEDAIARMDSFFTQDSEGDAQGLSGIGVLVDDEAVQLRQLGDGAHIGRDDDVHEADFMAFALFFDHITGQLGVVHLIGQHDLGIGALRHDVRDQPGNGVAVSDQISV